MKIFNYKVKLVIVIAWQLLYSLSNVLFAFVLMNITDSLIQYNLEKFKMELLIAFVVVCFQVVTCIISMQLKNRYIRNCIAHIRIESFRSILKMNYDKYYENNISYYLSYFTNDLNMIEASYIQVTIDMIGHILLLSASSFAILILNWRAFVVILLSIVISMILPMFYSSVIQKANDKYVKSNEVLLAKTKEYLTGFETIKSFKINQRIEKRYNKDVLEKEKRTCDFGNKMILGNSMVAFISVILILLIFLVGGYSVIYNRMTMGSLIALVQLSNNLISPISEILYGINERNSVKNVVSRCLKLMNHEEESKQSYQNQNIEKIEVCDLRFTYNDEDKKILQGINLILEKGKKYALIGKNGCGKSTLAKVLSGRLCGYQGEIKYNNIVINNKINENIDHCLSYINQDIFLFNESVMNNLSLFGKYDDADIEDIVSKMDLNSLLSKDFTTEKENIPLSGGEKQKIAIARTILDKKDVIVCDEIDSALDAPSKSNIINIIMTVQNAICLVITHNISSSLKKFDEIIVMDKGIIVEQGKYDELYNLKGHLYELLQSVE